MNEVLQQQLWGTTTQTQARASANSATSARADQIFINISCTVIGKMKSVHHRNLGCAGGQPM